MPTADSIPVTVTFVLWLQLLRLHASASPVDYWSDNFDEGANCKQTDLINNQLKQLDQCESVQMGNETHVAFTECKTRLQKKVHNACAFTKVKKPGSLLYCKIRTLTECCFHNHSCASSWSEINAEFGNETAMPYMKDKEKVLAGVEKSGYKKCYPISGLDASKCAEDCKQAANEEFAKNCTTQGGFFKCCVRRDKRDCHECRFCCSLPLCTLNTTQGFQTRGMTVVLEKDQENEATAAEKFSNPIRLWKSRDYRCLKPDDSKPSAEWPHYVHEEFKKATTKEELDKASTIPFDINFMNFEDPEVLERFVGPDYQKYWKETYGVDHASKVTWDWKPRGNETSPDNDDLRLAKHCVEAEYSQFAKKCKKKGGLFKCCAFGAGLYVFERVREDLAAQNLIEKPKKLLCNGDRATSECTVYLGTHICSIKDPLTGNIKTEFETPPQPKYLVGGSSGRGSEWTGFRTDFCSLLATCLNEAQDMDMPLYETAHSKETYCQAVRSSVEKAVEKRNITKQSVDTVDGNCKKQKLSTVIPCENDADLQGPRATIVTKEVREAIKEMDEKRKKDKKKKKKKSEKKKKKKDKEKRKKKDKKKKKD